MERPGWRGVGWGGRWLVRRRCMGLSPPAPQMTEWVVEEANTPHSLLQWKTNKHVDKKIIIDNVCM